jgi:hypothetical protein
VCCRELLAVQAIVGMHPDDPSVHLDVDPAPVSASIARHFIADKAGDDADDILSILTSELVTNGILHARTTLVVGLTTGRDRLLVTVADDNEATPRMPPPDDDRPNGRGLMLVDALASEWGVFQQAHCKTVWFTLPRASLGDSR